MKRTLNLWILTTVLTTQLTSTFLDSNIARAQTGNHGGDLCEDRFQEISRDLKTFLKSDQVALLTLPAGLTVQALQTRVLNLLEPYLEKSRYSEIAMACVSARVFVGNEEKTCAWSTAAEDPSIKDGKTHVSCNINRYNYGVSNPGVQANLPKDQLDSIQYKLTIHEWLSLAGIEKNTGSISDYFITDQINSTGGYVEKYQLGVKSGITRPHTMGVKFNDIVTNPDHSVTITGITISRGGQTFRVDKSSGFDNVCRVLGYEDSLFGPSFNQHSYDHEITISLDEHGRFKSFVDVDRSRPITKVTCYNRKTLLWLIDFQKTQTNDDGSVIISNIYIKRGPSVFRIDYRSSSVIISNIDIKRGPSVLRIDYRSSLDVICRAIGYEDSLFGPGFDGYTSAQEDTIMLDSQSMFAYYSDFKSAFPVTKVTCINGKEPLVILVGGNIYRIIRPAF